MKKRILSLALALQVSFLLFAQTTNSCLQSLLNDNYSSTTGWTQVGTNTQIAGGVFKFQNTKGGVYDRQYKFVPGLAANSNYIFAQCKFMAQSGNGPGHHILTLSAQSIDPVSFDASGGYAANTNEGIMVDLTAPIAPSSNNSSTNPTDPSNPWQFNLRYKIGTTLFTSPLKINLPAANTWYYIQLERGGQDLKLSVFSNASYTAHVPGSPFCFTINGTISPLNYVNHGVYTWAGSWRRLTGKIDNLKICRGFDRIDCCVPITAVSAGADIKTCCPSNGTQLNAVVTGGVPTTITWSPATGLSNPNILNPICTTTGTYIVTVSNGCSSVSDTINISANGGISCCRKAGAKANAYPNPSTSNFNIAIPQGKFATVFISNLYGAILEKRSNASGTIQMGSKLQQGSYTITILYKDGTKEEIKAIKSFN